MSKTYQFSVEDAQQWKSADIAAILHNLRFWLAKNKANNQNIHDGRIWTYNTVDAWVKLFPWLSPDQIKRLLKKMEQAGVLLKGNYNQNKFDKTVWYTLDEPEFLAPKTTPKTTPKTYPKAKPPKPKNRPAAPVVVDSAKSPNRDGGTAYSETRDRTISTDKKQTYITTTTDKPDFDVFALALLTLIKDMIDEGGWTPEGQPVPKASWLKAKAKTLYDKFPDPSPEDCAVIVLKDWSSLVGNNHG